MTNADERMNPLHFGTNLENTRIQKSGYESWITLVEIRWIGRGMLSVYAV